MCINYLNLTHGQLQTIVNVGNTSKVHHKYLGPLNESTTSYDAEGELPPTEPPTEQPPSPALNSSFTVSSQVRLLIKHHEIGKTIIRLILFIFAGYPRKFQQN